MSLSVERMAIANHAIQQTFRKSSVAWQEIPHWDTGDPGQIRVRDDIIFKIKCVNSPPVPPPSEAPFDAVPIRLDEHYVDFRMTLAQAMASTPDALLAAVMARTVVLAQRFDDLVFCKLPASAIDANSSSWYRTLPDRGSRPPKQHPKQYPNVILTALIEGRQLLEDSGFRAPSCLIASTKYFTDLHQWVFDTTAVEPLLAAANVNSLHRATQLDKVPVGKDTVHLMLMVGRRQQIAPGCADVASPGEEPVDLAISVPPSLEVDGENTAGELELAVRVRFATRVKDQRGVVVFHPSNE